MGWPRKTSRAMFKEAGGTMRKEATGKGGLYILGGQPTTEKKKRGGGGGCSLREKGRPVGTDQGRPKGDPF